KIEGGSAHNIIPETVRMIGTVRTFSEENAYLIRDRMKAIVKSAAEAAGAAFEFSFNEGYPPVINDSRAAGTVIGTAEALLGLRQVELLEKPIMAGEDFAFYQQHFPGAFFFLVSGSEQSGAAYSWHHPKYNVDERCFKTGAALMAALAFQQIKLEKLNEV